MADTETVSPAGRARWSWFAALGLFLQALGPLVMLAGGLIWGLEIAEEVPFFGVTAGAALLASFLVLRFGTWAKILGMVVAFLVAGALFWTAFGLFTPNSFFDFFPGVVVIPGALIAIVSCIAAIVASRREHRTSLPIGGERTAVRVAMGIVLVLGILSGALTFTGRETVDASTEAAFTVTTHDFSFDSETYEVDGGDSVIVRNDDPFLHTFSIDELDVDEPLSPGTEILVTLPEEPGTYVLYCRPHTSDPADPSEEDMAAEITIR